MVFRKPILLILWLVACSCVVRAQTLDWDQVYGGDKDEQIFAVALLPDSSFVATGYTTSQGAGGKDILLLKFDRTGAFDWITTYGGAADDWGFDIRLTTDNHLIVAGYTTSFGSGAQAYAIKTDLEGGLIWGRIYGGAAAEYGYSIVETDDGGFILVGETESFGAGLSDVYIIKLDAGGIQDWTKFYGGSGDEWGSCIAGTADGNFIITGYTTSYGGGNYDIYLLKIDPDGDTIWTATNGTNLFEGGEAVIETSTGDFIVGGLAFRGVQKAFDACLIGFDQNGGFLWDTFVGAGGSDAITGLVELPNDRIIAVGETAPSSTTPSSYLYLAVDLDGDSLYSETFGGTSRDRAQAVIQADDEGVAIVGYTESFGSQYQAYVVRVNHDFLCGDMDGSGGYSIADAVYLIAWVFGAGPAPFPRRSADYDCSGGVNLADAVALIGWTFGEGPPPCADCAP